MRGDGASIISVRNNSVDIRDASQRMYVDFFAGEPAPGRSPAATHERFTHVTRC